MSRADVPNDLSLGQREASAIAPALIRRELDRITSSKAFQPSRRHQKLLRHLVEQAIAGQTAALKEPVLALEVFERPLAGFDPARDTIVRVEARRLRQRIERYYDEEGADAVVEIRLPVGSYVPTLRRRDAAVDATRHAKDLTERGEHFLRQPLARESLETARERFEEALRESPRYVPALVGLGRAWLNLASGWYREPAVASEHAAEALRRALELDPAEAVAHALLGAVQHQFEYDWPAARASFERASALAPQQAFVHSAFGLHLLSRGDFDEAERELQLARRLDPQYANARMHMANLRIGQRRLDQARAELEAILDIAPASAPAHGLAALLELIEGRTDAAIAGYRRACELAPDYALCHASLAAALGAADRVTESDQTMSAMYARFGDACVSPYVAAIVAARCRRFHEACALIEQAIRVRDPSVMYLPTDPSFDALRRDPRWPKLLALRVPPADR